VSLHIAEVAPDLNVWINSLAKMRQQEGGPYLSKHLWILFVASSNFGRE